MISGILQIAAWCLFLAGAVSFGTLFKGCYVLRRLARRSSRDMGAILLKSPQMPVVSVIAVATDASAESRAFVRRLLDLHFANHEVVLVLDGPPEHEFEKWTVEFRLIATGRGTWESIDPLRLVVVKTQRAGVAAACNAGVSMAAGSIIALFDPQSEFIPEALLRLTPPMLRDPEGITGVCGMAPEIASASAVQRFAAIESLRLWLARCAVFADWNMLVPVPGSCTLVRRDAIRQAGGFPVTSSTAAAPLELILHLHGKARAGGAPFRMALVAEPVSRMPVPKSSWELRALILRDQRALRDAFRNRRCIARGILAIGWGMPGLFWDRFARPLLETVLYLATAIGIAMGLVPTSVGALVLLCTIGTGILLSMSTVIWHELAEYRASSPGQLARLFFAAIPENLGYRQIRNLWLVGGFLKS